jgi:CheY-like chemotaxis protein
VLESENGNEALRVVGSSEDEIQLVITDMVMPLMGGRELAQRLAVLRPEIPVLFMSGYIDDAIVRDGVMDMDLAFLQKPFTPESLVGKVLEILQAKSAE